ncbi:hypothetical protein DY000_02047790 [Brassica cretica]|uniref:ABC transporter domain-containing protein n=1 Tax=Brassica cretica TaxID=69181 RepID=A0ABQ7ERJ1_BRACR|nr:hypothetical protein DY000_02047790 [Brassica cretica]
MEVDKAFHEEYKVKKKRQLLLYAAWMFVEEVMELVELKPLKNSILGLPRVNGRLPEQRKRLTISMFVEEVMELVELKPLKNSILGLPRVNGRLPEQRKRLTISVELVALSLIFMDEPTSGMQRDAAIVILRASHFQIRR